MANKLTNQQLFEYGCYQILDHFLGRNRAHKLTISKRTSFYRKLMNDFQKGGEGKVIPLERR